MFSKLTAASLCVCNNTNYTNNTTNSNVALISEAKPVKMIDTQMKREPSAMIRQAKMDKLNNANSNDNQLMRVNNMQVQPLKNNKAQDINCNMQQKWQASQPLNHVMSVSRGKRSPKSLDVRKEEVMAIRNRFPTKVPIIVQRFCKETALPQLDKFKYLVPQEITMSQFLTVIRNRMHISSTQTLYLLVNNRSMISLSLTLSEVYNEYAGSDGFLYVTYASQEVFGGVTAIDAQEEIKGNQAEYNNFASKANKSNKSLFHVFLDNTYKSMCYG